MVETASVSVIIPAYNVAGSLARCVRSALEQDPRPLEVIVVDDGSTDETAEVAASLGEGVTLLRQDNAGQGAARNTGLAAARGEFIAFLDADDFWDDGFLAATTAFMRDHGEAVAVNTAHVIQRDGKRFFGPAGMVEPVADDEAAGWMLEDFFATWAEKDHVRTGTVLIRHEVIRRAGGQLAELRISQDLEYWGYIATFGPWGFIPRPLWVGDSAAHAAAVGWLKRYRKRRRLCPTVEQWQRRLLPRVAPEQMDSFKRVRGRVAIGYARGMLLAGRRGEARQIVRRYGAEMPAGGSTSVLRMGNLIPLIGWPLACGLIRARETAKALRAWLRGRSIRRAAAAKEGSR